MVAVFLQAAIPVWLTAVISVATLLFGGAGVIAWFKLGPERGKMVVDAAQVAMMVHSGVLKDVREQYHSVTDEFALLKMEMKSLEDRYEKGVELIRQLQHSTSLLHIERDSYRKMEALARRKAHIALNTMASYELLFERLYGLMSEKHVLIPPELRTSEIRKKLREEMQPVEEVEAALIEKFNTNSTAGISD